MKTYYIYDPKSNIYQDVVFLDDAETAPENSTTESPLNKDGGVDISTVFDKATGKWNQTSKPVSENDKLMSYLLEQVAQLNVANANLSTKVAELTASQSTAQVQPASASQSTAKDVDSNA